MMNSLQEISDFVGMQPFSMRGVGDLIPMLSDDAKTSMQSMIRELEGLPPITLEAEAIGNRFGDAPFRPTFRIHPSAGAVTQTAIILFANGAQPEMISLVGNSGDFTPFTLVIPGIFAVQIRRTGVQATGVVVLDKNFHIETVQPPPAVPPPLIHPVIAVTSNGDGTYVVTGSGFLRNVDVHIRIVNIDFGPELNLTTKSNGSGELVGFKTPKVCVNKVRITFTANDGRKDPDDHPLGVLFSNSVTVNCPV